MVVDDVPNSVRETDAVPVYVPLIADIEAVLAVLSYVVLTELTVPVRVARLIVKVAVNEPE
jgi:hypothetical protein